MGCLKLSRLAGESVHIGPDVRVVVIGVERAGGRAPRVKLMVEAPDHVTVLRGELKARTREVTP